MVYVLLVILLLAPVVGAGLLRIFEQRLQPMQALAGATVAFGLAIASSFLLARSDVTSLRIGDLTLLLPSTLQFDVPIDLASLPSTAMPLSAETPIATPLPPATPTERATETPRATATGVATETPPATETAIPPSATPEPPTETPVPTAAGEPQRYTIQPGDTLGAIATRFNVSVTDILRANNLTPAEGDALQPGQTLIIPSATTSTGNQRRYTIQSGDTLGSIAEQFKVSITDILRVNNLTPAEGDALQVGQELIIP